MNFNSDALKDYDRHELQRLNNLLIEAGTHVDGEWHDIHNAVEQELYERIRAEIQTDYRRLFREKPKAPRVVDEYPLGAKANERAARELQKDLDAQQRALQSFADQQNAYQAKKDQRQ